MKSIDGMEINSICQERDIILPHRPVCCKSKVNSELGLNYSSMSLNSKQQLPLDMYERGILSPNNTFTQIRVKQQTERMVDTICGWMGHENKIKKKNLPKAALNLVFCLYRND